MTVKKSGYVNVGAGTRISWGSSVDPLTVWWLVAGRDERTVKELGKGMLQLCQGRREGEGVKWDFETQMWTVRGRTETEEALRKLEAFALLTGG